MRIGIDFDNTIVSYDSLFHKVALERGIIPTDTQVSKLAVRDYLRNANQEEIWTEMQGYVYGARMEEANSYPGLIEALSSLKLSGHELFIVSHKTQYPYVGESYDLHQAARAWISRHLQYLDAPLIEPSSVFFNKTKDEKIKKISHIKCDVFFDDLPEILLAKQFPVNVRKCLFDPCGLHIDLNHNQIVRLESWKEILHWIMK
jgi:hypothetical protein